MAVAVALGRVPLPFLAKWAGSSVSKSHIAFPMQVTAIPTQQSRGRSLGLWWAGPEVPLALVSRGAGHGPGLAFRL